MAANVETMAYAGETPWHGLGTRVVAAMDSETALQKAGLLWAVRQEPVTFGGKPVPGYQFNIRSTDNSVLGVVGRQYTPVQNREAFSFMDQLLGAGVRYETAGAIDSGRRVWMLAVLPDEVKLAGDPAKPYILLSNAHDGSGALRVLSTPVRVVCQNTLNLALRTATRSWAARHTSGITGRVNEAERTLQLSRQYLKELEKAADCLARTPVTAEQWRRIVEQLMPVNGKAEKPAQDRMKERQQELFTRVYTPDLANFRQGRNQLSGWGIVNAVADFVDHSVPLREAKNFRETRFEKVTGGHPWLDDTLAAIKEIRTAAGAR